MSDGFSWIDSHAHLTMFDRKEVPGILERASRRGVAGILVPATCRDDLDDAIGLSEEYPHQVVAAAGLHPHEAASLDAGLKRRIERALRRDGVVAVGEIGLDYHYMNSPREDQLAAFEWQLDLAMETGQPVILHNRESWDDLEARLAERQGGLRGVCHSFSEGPDEGLRVMELGLRVGISGMVTFKAAHNIREMVAVLEPDLVLVETDSPFLAPTPHRGKSNEPSYVPLVGQRLAEEWGKPAREIASLSTAGFLELFDVGEGWPGGLADARSSSGGDRAASARSSD
jgi:TatD DNase family protein